MGIQTSEEVKMNELTERIAHANGFELGSLPANQRGEKTPEQNTLLFPKLIAPLIFVFFSMFFLYFLLNQQGYLKAFSLATDLTTTFSQLTNSIKVIGGIMIAISIWATVIMVQLILDIIGSSVRMLEGLGYRKITASTDDDGNRTTRLYYVIEGKKFTVKRAGFSVFEDGRQYKAYFTPRRKVLVNIEVVK